MAFPKPTDSGEWASGPDADIQDPLPGQRALGWVAGEAPRAGTFNKLFNTLYQWAQYVSTYEDTLRAMPLAVTALWTYSAGVSITAGGLSVVGGLTLSGGANVAGTLNVTSGGANVTGPVAVTGTLGATGNTTVGGTLGVTGNTTVGGTLGVTGAATVGSLDAGSGAISGGAVSGSTATFSGTVTGAHPFTYGAPTTAYFYVDPIQMVADPYGDTADQGRLNEAAIGLGFWETSKIGTVAPTLYMRVPLPRGATITAIGILAYNADIAARSLQSIRVTIVTGGTGTAAPTTAEIQATGAGENISIPSGTNPPVWFAVPLAAGTHVVPSNGYVRMAIDMEETTNRGEQRVYGVRFVCSVPAVRDMT